MRPKSLWRRLRSRFAGNSTSAGAQARRREVVSSDPPGGLKSEPPALDPDERVIASCEASEPFSVEQALAAVERLKGRGREDSAIARILEMHRKRCCPSPLALAGARALLGRGEHEMARRLLEGDRTPEALVLLADAAAAREHLADALELAERALAYDLDAPGARERLQRWRPRGGDALVAGDQPTLLSKDLPETSLRIVAEAGRGGAATVYRAHDDVLARDVALKVYHRPELDRDKLVREARMAVTLAMRGVVHIFDADPGHGWIAMEYVQRGALADLLRAGDTTELHPARGWFRDLIEVVACIHERGFVHADLKPANVLIQGPSQVLVSDFGLALPFGSPHLGASAGYVSPERQAGASASAPDDVFSLGCILERVLDAVGERGPFATEPWRALADRLTRGDRPPDAGAALALVPATRAPEP